MLLNILSSVAEVITEVATGLFTNSETNNSNETYEYWKYLSYDEQESYFNNNEYLKDYITSHYYKNDRHMTAKKVQELADKLNREFTNKYDRY